MGDIATVLFYPLMAGALGGQGIYPCPSGDNRVPRLPN